jgi:large subunit ribosomal protein L21
MYAVLKTGGKQYRVQPGDRLRVEKLEVSPGDAISLDQVLMVVDGASVRVGKPFLDGASVSAVVKEHGRGDKIRIVKFRRRKHYRKQMGHRQHYTLLEVTSIAGGQ